MNEFPEIEWLQRKWDLPAHAIKPVRDLLQEEGQGSTACKIEGKIPGWGKAAAKVSEGDESPLVILESGEEKFLQSRLLYTAERDIAHRLLEMANRETNPPADEEQLAQLFPHAVPGDHQVEAARRALARELTLITGGPGTGKTYTLARILALLVTAGISAKTIRLAAPTGKAADRMKKAVADSLAELPSQFQASSEALARVAESSSTLHSLLGYNPGEGRCRFNARNPLACEVVIVDECSMVDVRLWNALLKALPPAARLVLLGDPNQLESVGQGNVFAEVVRRARQADGPLNRVHVHLTEARRFKDRPNILAFAQALESANPLAAEELLHQVRGAEPTNGLAWIEPSHAEQTVANFPEAIRVALEKVARAETPEAALEALGNICILTPHRSFFSGASALSFAVNQHLSQFADVRNQPIIINHNDPETALRNGTVGVIHVDSSQKRMAYFPAGDGKLRSLAVAKLPDFSPAWAITIHRSQGSEYDDVLVILPREESPMATRELLYTAITRAKRNVFVSGDLESVKKAAVTSSKRITMLPFLLG